MTTDVPRTGRASYVRAMVRSTVGCAIAALVGGTWLVDGLTAPLVVASGSMAPALRGPRVEWTCKSCRRPFACGVESLSGAGRAAVCPSCRGENDPAGGIVRPGDRVVVDRSAFLGRAARRFEPVVLRSPDEPSQMCVKRIVGLPGEQVRIASGELWVNGRLVRKTLDEIRQVAVEIGPVEFDRVVTPHADADQTATDWTTFRHVAAPTDESNYDQSESRLLNPLGDVLLCGDMSLAAPGDVTFSLASAGGGWLVRWRRGAGNLDLESAGRAIATFDAADVPQVHPTRFEWMVVDCQVRLVLNGQTVIEYPFEPRATDDGVGQVALAIGAKTATKIELSNVKLFRDVYYAPTIGGDDSRTLGSDEYFVLGDNANHSIDGRHWSRSGGISASLIVGKALWW